MYKAMNQTCKVGQGRVVHLVAPNGKRAACGAGDSHIGHRAPSRVHTIKPLAESTVTCSKCQQKLAEMEPAEPTQADAPKTPENVTCTICGTETDGGTTFEEYVICKACYDRAIAYAVRREERADRMEERADKAYSEFEARQARARQMAQAIPFGQPILRGHHSEGWDRRYRQRIEDNFRKAFQLLNESNRRRERAEAARSNRAVSSDDPAAVLKLKDKLAKLEEAQETMKRRNALVRQVMKRDDLDEKGKAHWLVEQDSTLTFEHAVELVIPDYMKRTGYPAYALTNNGAEIRRLKARIEKLQAQAARAAQASDPVAQEERGDITIERDLVDNRIRLIFPGKPDEETRRYLKSRGFRWSNYNKAWQRQLNNAGEHAAEAVLSWLEQNNKV